MIVWRIAASTPDFTADDISGRGAAMTGGRWNPPGIPALYCASSISLAYVETLAHIDPQGPMPRNRFRVRIDIPDPAWEGRRMASADRETFPLDWNAHPVARGSVEYGGKWLRSATEMVLVVPSCVIPQEDSIVLNPAHRDFAQVRVLDVGRIDYDHRLFSGIR